MTEQFQSEEYSSLYFGEQCVCMCLRIYLIRYAALSAGPGLAKLSPQLLLLLLAAPAQFLHLLIPTLKLCLPLPFPFQKCLFKQNTQCLRPFTSRLFHSSRLSGNLCFQDESHTNRSKVKASLLSPDLPSRSSGPGVPPPGCSA